MNSSENSTFKVQLLAQPRSYLKRLDRSTQKRIATAIEAISANPLSGPNIKPLQGFRQKYRYRVGDIRIIYSVKIQERLIIVEVIGPRGDVYKK
ncbi:MAG TPA: type II toxin-antitoxin system RelE/ParE family toxin [Peptococcaceae bacterium]|nr:MAG: Plasmid stabilization system [Moorella sp. 60_41]HBT47254.1 type II toxin-antitoxin system RelE/ParE family toxin [Peptococcaceae bacterium]